MHVVIDGDGAPFNDFLYAQGKEGGTQAAHQLQAEIKSSLRAKYPDAAVDDWNIVVQIVLNLQGLANKLVACGIISNPNEVFAFGRAFGLAQPLFSFVDVGQGKVGRGSPTSSDPSTNPLSCVSRNTPTTRFAKHCGYSYQTLSASMSFLGHVSITDISLCWNSTRGTLQANWP